MDASDSTGGTEGGPRTERNERRSNVMIADEVTRAVSTVTGSEVTGPVDELAIMRSLHQSFPSCKTPVPERYRVCRREFL